MYGSACLADLDVGLTGAFPGVVVGDGAVGKVRALALFSCLAND